MLFAEPMARSVLAPAARELLRQAADGEEHTTTVPYGGDDFTLYGHIRVRRMVAGQAEVAVACWLVNIDLARSMGGHPPTTAETRLPPKEQPGRTEPSPSKRPAIWRCSWALLAIPAAQPMATATAP